LTLYAMLYAVMKNIQFHFWMRRGSNTLKPDSPITLGYGYRLTQPTKLTNLLMGGKIYVDNEQ
jgi:hypothetical protein